MGKSEVLFSLCIVNGFYCQITLSQNKPRLHFISKRVRSETENLVISISLFKLSAKLRCGRDLCQQYQDFWSDIVLLIDISVFLHERMLLYGNIFKFNFMCNSEVTPCHFCMKLALFLYFTLQLSYRLFSFHKTFMQADQGLQCLPFTQ